ncbi:hypothetical protein DFP72DRAFT_867313 [Ephemerocybe angulata]|uniref:Fork-head domain-containing protein n=1 Tax=Ephemerocybe angulata TaxID=980116 RepID=A0A8H6IJ78_9AGAR|nr:hypothetical protein DFP72DRAFT_867313 [Tulosesus angulatus]
MSHLSNILNPEGSRAGSENAPNSEASTAGANQDKEPEFPPPPPRGSYSTFEHAAHPDCPDTLACLPDSNGRPQHTLPVILRCAILGSPRKRLTIREIYQAMEEKYSFYKTAGPTWKQSVRHHLSLNRLFERQPRPVTDPGFGSYWTVNLSAPPGTKRPRKRGRNAKDSAEGPSKSPTEYEMAPLPGTSSAAINHALNNLAPPVGRRRGRPRKASGTSTAPRDETPISSHGGDDADGVITPLDGPPESDDEYDSRDEDPAISPFDHHGSGAPYIPPSYTHNSRPSMAFQLPPMNNSNTDDPSQSVIERLREEVGILRRQSAEAVSVSLRLSEQLAQAQREIERSRNEIRDLEDALEDEQGRRLELERRRGVHVIPPPPQPIVPPSAVRSPERNRGPI